MPIVENKDNSGVVGYYIGHDQKVSIQDTTQDECDACGKEDGELDYFGCLIAITMNTKRAGPNTVVLCYACAQELIETVPRVFTEFVESRSDAS